MNDKLIRKRQTITRVREFMAAHAASFLSSKLGIKQIDNINEAVAELDIQAATENSSSRAATHAAATKADIRKKLHNQLSAICRTARSIAVDKPLFDAKFRAPNKNSDRLMLNAARGFASDIAAFADDFIQHEMPADFLDQFKANIELFEKTLIEQNLGTETRIAANVAIEKTIGRGMKAVMRLDSIVRNKFRDDPVTLAEWESVSRVARAARSSKTPKTDSTKAPEAEVAVPAVK